MRIRCGLIAALFLVSCIETNDAPEALRYAQTNAGASIVWDLEARPFPEIPFPNDVATRLDPTSPTGRRVNVSYLGASKQEERVREHINRLTGFGIVSPMWLKFDALLDLQNIVDRHHDDVPDFSDDAIYLINVDRDSASFGEHVLIDLGRGNYPILNSEPDRYFDNDPRKEGTNTLFESVREFDLNGNGVLDPIEDTDDDGVWDEPNLLDQNADPYKPGNTLEWYERETNSLILRPVEPLQPETTYAVVMTSKLLDAKGFAINSPFEGINHTRQTEALEPLREILPKSFPDRFTANLKNVRFAWTFTTQDPTAEMQAIRAGLYGSGTLGWLSDEFPAEIEMIHNVTKPGADEPLTYDPKEIINLLIPLFGGQVDTRSVNAIVESFENVDYLVSGSFVSPYFMPDRDGLADTGVLGASLAGNPQDDDEIFEIDVQKGLAEYGEDEISFICSVPTTIPGVREPPFNTVMYSHAISSTRLEILLFAGSMGKFGFAVCAIDAVGHGVGIPPEFDNLVANLTESLDVPNFKSMVDSHRARDLTNNGFPDSGGKYFTSDLLHVRDNSRQSTIDQMQFLRMLRTWDGQKRWPDEVDEDSVYVQSKRDLVGGFDQDGDGQSEIAGDFNGDGVIDFGGDVSYVSFGTSLGGIQTANLSALEPIIKAAASNAGGGILGDIATRTTISNVRNGGILRMLGPTLVGVPQTDETGQFTGTVFMAWILATADEDVVVPIGFVDDVAEGDKIVLRNPIRDANPVVPEDEKFSYAHVRNGRFRVSVSADALEATKRRGLLQFDPSVSVVNDIMDCQPQTLCGETECGSGNTCSKDDPNLCLPITNCIWNFEESSLADGEQSVRAEMNRHTISDERTITSEDVGDPLIIEIYDAEGNEKRVIDTFIENTVFENIFYPKGTKLTALMAGLGLKRQTPNFRKFASIAQTILEPGDPGIYATHYFQDPFEFPYEEKESNKIGTTNFLMIGTVGDQVVPISASIAIARTAGILDTRNEDPRLGKTQNQFLIDNFVYEGIYWLNRFPEYPGTLFDPDNIDGGKFGPNVNVDAEVGLRATVETENGIQALRFVYLDVEGEHTFNAPLPSLSFDGSSFMTNLVGWYLVNSGRELIDTEPCIELLSMKECDFVDILNFEPPKLR